MKTAVRAYVSGARLRHNVAAVKGHCADGVRFCAVVKADGYGHDASLVVGALAGDPNVDWFGVRTIGEGLLIHRWVKGKPIMVLGPIFSGIEPELVRLAQGYGFHCGVCSAAAVRYVDGVLGSAGTPLGVHLKVDTGMGRLGCAPGAAVEICGAIGASRNLKLAGIYTHLATADETDLTFAQEQLAVFDGVLAQNGLAKDATVIKHTCNSAGALRLPGGHFDMVRVGIALYGYLCEELHGQYDLRPVLRLEAPLVEVKQIRAGQSCGYGRTFIASADMTVGVLPVGYADGLQRCLSNRGSLRIAGQYVPIVGRVSMDNTIVDLTGVANPSEGDMVTVIDDDPASRCNAQGLADLAETIPYEMLTSIGPRVQRVARA